MDALDRIDHRLLALLQRDARLTHAELAEQVALSPSACLRRVQKLERLGVISGYRAILNPTALGLTLTAFVRVQLERHDSVHVQRFAELVADGHNVFNLGSDVGALTTWFAQRIELLRNEVSTLPAQARPTPYG